MISLVVYFEPRTGIIRRQLWETNFHVYRLRNSRTPIADGYTITWLEENVRQATVGSSGLEYPPEFWQDLQAMEDECDRASRLLVTRLGTSLDEIPPRQDGNPY